MGPDEKGPGVPGEKCGVKIQEMTVILQNRNILRIDLCSSHWEVKMEEDVREEQS